jgi:peptidoglycan hydrolase CwlO-like protein
MIAENSAVGGRTMRAPIYVLALLLCGCGDAPQSKDEVQTIAHDAAIDATSEQFSDLTDNVTELQNTIEQQNADIEELGAENQNLADRVQTLEQQQMEIRDRLNM